MGEAMFARFAIPTVYTIAASAAALVLSLTVSGALSEARAEIKLRLTHSAPVSHPNHIAAVNMTLISNYEWGFRSISNSARAINSPEDVKGLKIRVPPVAVNKNTMEALGAIAAPIAFAELYMALSTGTVDGQENPVSTIWASKFYEVQKYVALTRHIYTMMMFAANTNVWNKLTPKQRQIIAEEGQKAAAEARTMAADEEDVLIGKLKTAGVTITTPDPAKFRAAVEPANTELRKAVGDADWKLWQGFIE